jgi:competence protein ComEA
MSHTTARRGPGSPQNVEPSGAPWRVLETEQPDPPPVVAARHSAVTWLAIGGAVLAALVALVGLVLAVRADPGTVIDGPPASDATDDLAASQLTSPALDLVVDVGGAVARPGVYHLPEGSRVTDAIAAAGGFGARVDADRADRELNLAAVVHDGDQIRVPVRGERTADGGAGQGTGSGGSGSTTSGALIDLNRASADELDTLPGIGPVTAAKIIAAREEQPFASVDDLAARKVVGPATLTKIRALVTVGP